MSVFNKRQLHNEDKQRYEDAQKRWTSSSLDLSDIFRYPQLTKLISTPGIRIHYSEIQTNLFSVALHDHVLLPLCPLCDVNLRTLKPLLETGFVIPVLNGPYRKFPTKTLREIVLYPHISHGEHLILREARLENSSEILCGDCLERKVTDAAPSGDERFRDFSRRFCAALSPALDSDMELVERFCFALKAKKITEVKRLKNLASLVAELRSCYALNAIPSVTRKEFEDLSQIVPSLQNQCDLVHEPESECVVADSLQLERPASMSIERYLEIILPFKSKLQAAVESILNEAKGGSDCAPLSSLYSIASEINEQIRATQRSRRYQVLQATVGFAASNPVLVRSVLVGGALGLCTSIFGCGASTVASAAGISAVTSAGLRMLAKAKKVTDSRFVTFRKTLARDVRSGLEPALASYLNMDVRALQIWEVRNALQQTKLGQ